jgi:predicted transposase YbfD/YdcC
MENMLEKLEIINQADTRQQGKIKYKLNEILATTFIAMSAGANNFVEIAIFAETHKPQLQKYFPNIHHTPSHDTIQRTYAMLDPTYIQTYKTQFDQMLNQNQGEKIKKLFHIDGKTQKGNGNNNQKPNHIVSAIDEKGFTIGEKIVNDKSNEITAIPQLLNALNLKDSIVTLDAMGTQKDIAAKIRQKKADYVLALKANQGKLYDEVVLFFDDPKCLAKCAHYRTVEKARNCLEVREYWQSTRIGFLPQKSDWAGFKSVIRVCCTVTKSDGGVSVQDRYFISSLGLDVELAARLVRGHWGVEVMHWFLDVMFLEDACRVLDKTAAFNLNLMRKLVLSALRLLNTGYRSVHSLSNKRFAVSCDPQLLDRLLML